MVSQWGCQWEEVSLEPPRMAVIDPSKIRGYRMPHLLRLGRNPYPFPQWTKSDLGCPYQEALLGPSLLPGPGHLWSLGDLQVLAVPSALGALGRE